MRHPKTIEERRILSRELRTQPFITMQRVLLWVPIFTVFHEHGYGSELVGELFHHQGILTNSVYSYQPSDDIILCQLSREAIYLFAHFSNMFLLQKDQTSRVYIYSMTHKSLSQYRCKYTVLAFRCRDLSCGLLSPSQGVACPKNMCSNQDFNLKIRRTMPVLLPLSYCCMLWRSWRDLNPRDISLCPSGFQDRSLQPLEYNSI